MGEVERWRATANSNSAPKGHTQNLTSVKNKMNQQTKQNENSFIDTETKQVVARREEPGAQNRRRGLRATNLQLQNK